MPERNVALLEQTMQHILDHPEKHDQNNWFSQNECGTAACFAGWACLLSGYRAGRTDEAGLLSNPSFVRSGDRLSTAGIEAEKLLGLTHDEAVLLFFPLNTREQLQLMIKDLVNGDDLRQHHAYSQEANPT